MLSFLNIIFLAIFILLAFLVLRVEHLGRKVKIVAIILIGLLIYFSIANLFASESIDLTSPKGVVNAVYVYIGWIGKTANNLWSVGKDTVNMVGNAIKFNATGS
jgi:glucan phosphoethanolaminetransferase (alkaline phosphatase superfamily)